MPDFKIDPEERDFVMAADGSLEITETAETACYLQLTNRRNAWVGDPESGSDLHLIAKKHGRDTINAMRDATTTALAVLERAGFIANVVVSDDVDERGAVVQVVTADDMQTGGVLRLTGLSPTGA